MRIAVLDQNKKNISNLDRLITGHFSNVQISGYTTRFAFATGVYDEWKGDVDLLLMYVSPGDEKCIELATDIKDAYPHIQVVFYSETSDCAENIFDASPLFFLKLPFKEDKLYTAVEKAQKMGDEMMENGITITSRGQTMRFPYSSIRCVECDARKMIFNTDSGFYETYMLISDVLEKLPEYFVQCHRSYIVNIRRIVKYGADGAMLNTNELIPISRSHQKEIKDLLG